MQKLKFPGNHRYYIRQKAIANSLNLTYSPSHSHTHTHTQSNTVSMVGQMVHMTSQDLEESDCGLIEVKSRNLPGWTEKRN
jgi:hypothetical protein